MENRSVVSMDGALALIKSWEKIRSLRNSASGSLTQSELKIADVCGELTGLELVTQTMNGIERAADNSITEWRNSILNTPGESESHEDPGFELLEIWESFRAIRATRDTELIRLWFTGQTYAVKFLIHQLLAKIPNE